MDRLEQFEPLPDARFTTEYDDGAEWIVSRATRNWLVLPFLSVWLIGWSFGGLAAMTQFMQGEAQAFVAVWLVGWLFGWLFAATWIGWQLSGRVQVTVSREALVYRWSMLLVSRTKRYDARQVRNLRSGSSAWPWSGSFFNISYPPFSPGVLGSVQFDYGGRTVKIMPGLDEAEGQAIADWLGHRLPARA